MSSAFGDVTRRLRARALTGSMPDLSGEIMPGRLCAGRKRARQGERYELDTLSR